MFSSYGSYGDTIRHAVQDTTDTEVARCLGWVSIAIGLTELAAPKQLDSCLGTGRGENAGVFRALGVREICHGIDILSHEDPTPGVWSRVAGDVLDSVLLGIAATKTRRPGRVLAAAAMVLPVVLADVFYAGKLPLKKYVS